MLGVASYPQAYIDRCRALIDGQLSAYRALAAGADATLVAAFEPHCFNSMVLALDNLFVHRLRNIEGKDGNPLNEVRLLCNALMNHQGTVYADKQIRLNPATSVLGLRVGDPVRLSEADFSRLASAFFAEIERRFLDSASAEDRRSA